MIKAAGLAEGKGVTVARTRAEAERALAQIMRDKVFGEAGAEVLIEEFLAGEEASLLAFTDGRVVRAMDSAQGPQARLRRRRRAQHRWHGRLFPRPRSSPPALYRECVERVLEPCLKALQARGIDYRGVIYAGLIITAQGPKVIEFNCRFGDPETQALLPRLKTDLVEIMLACVEGRLAEIDLEWTPQVSVCVAACSGGYPGPYVKGKVIKGLDQLPDNGDVMVFHAGTARNAQGELVTNGGRVLGVTVKDDYLSVAIERAYETMAQIKFEGQHYRNDIGQKALKRPTT